MKLTFTEALPDKAGYYWYVNFGEHTPCILYVKQDYTTKTFWAYNEEFCFEINPHSKQLKLDLSNITEVSKTRDGYQYGDQLWCYIPNPHLPSGKEVEPDCY